MATIKDIFLIVAAAAVGAFAMIGFSQMNQCNLQITELNQLCRVQMHELKKIANTTEFRRIINIIRKWSSFEIVKYFFFCIVGIVMAYLSASLFILDVRITRRDWRRQRQ